MTKKLSASAKDLLRRYNDTLAEFPTAPLVRSIRGQEWNEILELWSAGIITPETNKDGSQKINCDKNGSVTGGIFQLA